MTGIVDVGRETWRDHHVRLAAEGYGLLDLLTAVDRLGHVEVIARVVDPRTCAAVLSRTSVENADPSLATITGSHPAAGWHERETAEQFGVTFDGHPDPRPLLHREAPAAPPLLKSTALVERVATPWPGATDSDAARRPRRPVLPPGVRPEWTATS